MPAIHLPRFAQGYYLVMTRSPGCSASNVEALIRRYVPAAVLSTDSAQELSFRLPLQDVSAAGWNVSLAFV
jgi:hypothetical protein